MQTRCKTVSFVSVPVSSMMVSYGFRSVAMFLVMLGWICHGHRRLCYHLSLWRAKHAVPGARISLAAAWCKTGMDICRPSRVGSVKSATVNLSVSFIGRKADSLRHLSPGWLESSQLPSLRMRLFEAIGNEMKVAPPKKGKILVQNLRFAEPHLMWFLESPARFISWNPAPFRRADAST